jgi:hypothetical protein
VIPEGSSGPVEIEMVRLTPGGCVVDPAFGSPLLVGPVMEIASEGVVSVVLIDKLTEMFVMAEEDIESRLELDEEGTGVTVEITLGERVKTVHELATDNGMFVSDTLLFAGIENGADTCVGGLIL